MLNDIIKIDLHIHSENSIYKDGAIVSKSNVANISTLLDKLVGNQISLFAITDHNRFNYELYSAIKEEINVNESLVKNNLPGIEFDVVLEVGKPKCHIIAIFNDSNQEKVKEIENKMFSIRKLENDTEAYTIKEFEDILKAIKLEVILIVHQKQALDNTEGDTDSLSNACENPSEFIKVGYIDSLEYNYPRVEGIVKDSLRKVDLDFPIITGSDCHTWENYPFHSTPNGKKRDFTSFKCLPTFKGLLMSITSFSTRVNRTLNENEHYIKSISLNDIEYPLANGLNAIIGDNGSGKSLLLNLLANGDKKYYAPLVAENKVSYNANSSEFQDAYINYIAQGDINTKVRDGNLFEDSDNQYYENIANKEIFAQKIRQYFDDVLKYVCDNIRLEDARLKLESKSIKIVVVDKNFYRPIIKSDIQLEDIENDKKRKTYLNETIANLELELETNKSYYEALNVYDQFECGLNELKNVAEKVSLNYKEKNTKNLIKNLIKKHLNNYNTDLDSRRTSEETGRTKIIEIYDDFKKCILDFIRLKIKENNYPTFPTKMDGYSNKPFRNYEFKKHTAYHNIDLKEPLYKHCFNINYANETALKTIKTRDELNSALKNGNLKEIATFKTTRLEKFITDYSKETTSISEVSSKESIGNTPGEISLVYYKFLIQESEAEFYVLIIDQAEDDINPKRIKDFLLKYLSSIKDKKQVILVTHNPLLVVNLDVDNVIHLTKNNNKIEVKNGSLEYENADYSILDLIKNNLDGGYKAVERRLKIYERDED